MLKKIFILLIGGRKFIFYKFLNALKVSIVNFSKIFRIIEKKYLLFFFLKF